MLLKWKADNQLENWYSDLFVQYSQIVNRLAVYTEVFDNTTVMSASFSTFNASTQQWEEIDESTIALVGYRQDDARNGYIFSATMPVSVMMQDGVVGLALTAQTPTGYTDGNGDTVYQTQTSGIFKIFINKSLNNGTVPVPDNLNAIIQAIQNIDRNVVYADKFTASATTVSSQDPASATVTKDAETGITNIAFDIPAGKDGAKWYASTQIIGTGDNIVVGTISGANMGDYYLNTQTGNVYVCKAGTSASTGESVWSYASNIKGAKGDAGTFAISKVYASVEAMNAGFATDGLPIGALVVIETGNVDDPDNAKLFVKEANGYKFLTDMSGATGIQGPAGKGITSIVKTSSNGLVDTYTIYYSDDTTSTFNVRNGADGSKWSTAPVTGLTTSTGSNIVVTSMYGAKEGDQHLDPNTGNVYRCLIGTNPVTNESTWQWMGNIKGKDGATWRAGTYITGTGSDIVANFTGGGVKVGDLYLNTETAYVYRCKTVTHIQDEQYETVWTYETIIKGKAGEKWFTGTAVSGTGTDISVTGLSNVAVGDLYLNTTSGDVYECVYSFILTQSSSWNWVANIKGAKGDTYVLTASDKQEIAEETAELVVYTQPNAPDNAVENALWVDTDEDADTVTQTLLASIDNGISVVDSGLTYSRGVVELRKIGSIVWLIDSGVYNFTSEFAATNNRTVLQFDLPKELSNKMPNTNGAYGTTGTIGYFPALAYENVTYTTFNCQSYLRRTAVGTDYDTFQVVYTGLSAISGGGLCGFHLKMPIILFEEVQ